MFITEKPTIGVLGAGLMGHGLAQVFAVKGCDVTLYDRDEKILAASLDRIRDNLNVFVRLKIVADNEVEPTLKRIRRVNSLEEMCRDRMFIVEAVSENLSLKRKVFEEMEPLVPADTILSSNTSAISISIIAEGLQHPQRVLGTHFWNPPHIVPCVEVIKANQTDDDVFETVYRLMAQVGKTPVRVLKDVPGFLGNRMQHALWREAIKLVENGIASAEDVDKVVKSAFGLRLAFLGPLETADLAGLDLTHEIHQDLLPELDRSTTPSPLLEEKVKRGETGAKSGQGFHSWPPEKLKRLVEQRDSVLLRILQQVNSE
ncbi:3-hydroxyacyl-CoA dehydrogenase family protein [Desulfosarcina widdelii]|uniref:3-hydroxyacyl-CoA dehydrogenase family protein n=1 Tax=Desulfosarcina widdelii TaxID=947919 RepID=A0A5K7ZA03_9BACT|nr:3-hydroxyacyl-CoA dehydrogenase family protein [Desulfosarcina widdelii]BBO76979.1 3-hydroxyacyl-CoA dehydrogenase family protein [Desulfosarcina widdelii]